MRGLGGASAAAAWESFLHYVPGRNLFILFFWAAMRLTGGSIAGLHAVSALFDAANAALAYLLFRRLTGLRSVAWAGAVIFALGPNHGETHFWLSSIPQSQITAFLLLASFALAARPGGPRLAAAAALYAAALFTYEQVALLWPLLLAAAWRADPAPRGSRYAAAGAGLAALNAAQLALRYLSPFPAGPLIRWEGVLRQCGKAFYELGKGIIPLPTPSYAPWGWSAAAGLLALAAGLWAARAGRAAARAEQSRLAAWAGGREWRWPFAFGLAWTALAYAPNLFWFISPRHNLLPSAGWALSLAVAGAAASRRGGRLAALLPRAAVGAFVLAALADVHEGTQWIASRRLRDSFAREIAQVAPPVDSLFLVGAPRYLHRAPAFNLPHDVRLVVPREAGLPEVIGDYRVSPTRRGVVFANDLSIGPANGFRWIPAERVNAIAFDAATGAFACAEALALRRPDGGLRRLPLRPSPACRAEPEVALQAELLESRALPGGSAPGHGSAGLSLSRAELSRRGDAAELALEWSVGAPPTRVLALVPRVRDAAGRVVLDTVFAEGGGRRSYPVLWPLVDDLAPGARLRPGQRLREVFSLRRAVPAAAAGGTLEVDLFEIGPDGAARALGRASVPLSVPSSA